MERPIRVTLANVVFETMIETNGNADYLRQQILKVLAGNRITSDEADLVIDDDWERGYIGVRCWIEADLPALRKNRKLSFLHIANNFQPGPMKPACETFEEGLAS